MTTIEGYVAAVQAEVGPLVDLLVLVNDCAGLLGGTTAAQIDGLVRKRIAERIDEAALVEGPALIARSTLVLGLTGEGS